MMHEGRLDNRKVELYRLSGKLKIQRLSGSKHA